jgi:soluble lytic murein transglycosylase
MSTHAAHSRRRSASARRRSGLRRRLTALAVAGLAGAAIVTAMPDLRHAAKEITLPLRHEDVIRQQAAQKGLDPALIAGVIYAESHFRDQTSHAGARGLMQITPATARYIAHLSGGTTFEQGDLATPQINISYGTYYLRYLLDRYGHNEVLALAAYNGGEGNVDRWVAQAHTAERSLTTSAIPFAETRDYVRQVLDVRTRYRDKYASELGL